MLFRRSLPSCGSASGIEPRDEHSGAGRPTREEHGFVRLTLPEDGWPDDPADGTEVLILPACELLRRLAALVPPPRAHLVRYHGVFGPALAWRPQWPNCSNRCAGGRTGLRVPLFSP